MEKFKSVILVIQIIVFFTFEELGHGHWCRSLVSLRSLYLKVQCVIILYNHLGDYPTHYSGKCCIHNNKINGVNVPSFTIESIHLNYKRFSPPLLHVTYMPSNFFPFTRAEELETALMEMVKQDNRRELSAKVRHESRMDFASCIDKYSFQCISSASAAFSLHCK